MKLGKQPKRIGRPSDKFLATLRSEILSPPEEGPVRLFIDDDRRCPEGWTAVRTPDDFYALMNPDRGLLDRITHLSFDGSMGTGDDNDALELVDHLAKGFQNDPDYLPSLKAIGLHSTNRIKAVAMDGMISRALTAERRNTLFVQWGTPRLSMDGRPKGMKRE
jgi:hypothetical protein